MKLTYPLFFVVFLAGCADQKPHVENAPQSVAEKLPAEKRETSPVIDGVQEPLVTELRSINQSQQQQTGLVTAQLQKVADVVDAALVKISTAVTTTVNNQMKAEADLTATLRADVRNDLKVQADAQVNAMTSLESRIDAKLQAQVQAQAAAVAGIGNRIESMAQTYSSGRDTNTTQFTKEMAETLTNAQRQTLQALLVIFGAGVLAVLAAAAVLIVFIEKSRARAEKRAELKGVM